MIKRLICFVCQARGEEYAALSGFNAHLKAHHRKGEEVILIIVKA